MIPLISLESDFAQELFVFQHRADSEIAILLRGRIGKQRCGWL
jgi:hypothetical protein